MNTNTPKKRWFDVSYLPLIIAAFLTVFVVFSVFNRTQVLLKERLRERIVAIASTASLQFTGEEIQEVINNEDSLAEALFPLVEGSTESFNKEDYISALNQTLVPSNPILSVTNRMKKIRDANINLKYIYLLRTTDTENLTKFVSDSDTVIPVDWNENGFIDEIEYPPLPGEDYDVSDIPGIYNGLEKPIAMEELYTDKWGTFLSGYAPIKDANGNTVALLAIDIQVDEFYSLIRATLIPFLLLACLLLVMLSVQTFALVRIWKSRVNIMKDLDRQKDELLSIVSHQLATPVSSIRWYTEMMIDGDVGKLTKKQEEHVNGISSLANNLSDLVSMILDVSRIELGRMKADLSKFSYPSLVKDIMASLKKSAVDKGVKVKIDVSDKVKEIKTDKRLMRIIIENLLSNAIKYSEEKGNVSFTSAVKKSVLHIVVRDEGKGIPKSEQEKVFEKLYRGSNVQDVRGNGFGLFAVKGATETLGGTLSFESAEGKGTTFTIKIPLK